MELDGIVPTEDAVDTLLGHFVCPLLPLRGASHESPPSIPQQEAVAKQVHAVVILYNYYHRKHCQKLQFLDLVPFCKIATNAKPGLLRYLKFMNGSQEMSVDHLSLTEKAVKNACEICAALDASNGDVIIEGWPVTKVAVFLLDTTRTKCLLEFSSVTQGSWSVVEKAVDEIVNAINRPKEKRSSEGKKQSYVFLADRTYANEDILQELAFSLVEKETGLDKGSLCILGHHFTYSLTEERGATFLYIMTYSEIAKLRYSEVPVVDVISLRGPVLKMGFQPVTTSVVDYYPLLPYADKIIGYISQDLHPDGSFDLLGQMDVDLDKTNSKQGRDCDITSSSRQQEQIPKIISDEFSNAENRNGNSKSNKLSLMSASPNLLYGCKKVGGVSSLECNKLSKEPGQQVVATNDLLLKNSSQGRDADVDKNSSGASIRDRELDISGSHDVSVIPFDASCEHTEALQCTQGSKRNSFLFSSLQVVKRRRKELGNKQRALEDEIAQCELSVRKILSVGAKETNLRADSMMETCSFLGSSQRQLSMHTGCEDPNFVHPFRRKTLAEAFLNLRSPCKELDDICCENNWILARYTVLPSNSNDGTFWATVWVNGADFESSVSGEQSTCPSEARQSAASLMLSKLRTMASQAAI